MVNGPLPKLEGWLWAARKALHEGGAGPPLEQAAISFANTLPLLIKWLHAFAGMSLDDACFIAKLLYTFAGMLWAKSCQDEFAVFGGMANRLSRHWEARDQKVC